MEGFFGRRESREQRWQAVVIVAVELPVKETDRIVNARVAIDRLLEEHVEAVVKKACASAAQQSDAKTQSFRPGGRRRRIAMRRRRESATFTIAAQRMLNFLASVEA